MDTDKTARLSFRFTVEPYTEDATGCLSWSTLGNQLLRSAGHHASANGFGYDHLISHNLVWVLSRLVVVMDERPRTGQSYTITTWVKSCFRQFTERLFEVADANGRPMGHAYSIWAAIDYTTRQPIDLAELPDGGFGEILLPSPEFPIAGASRLRLRNAVQQGERRMGFSDLDINGHVNSMRYLELCLDLFDADYYRSNPLHRIELHFANETYCGDLLSVWHEPAADRQHLIEIKKDGAVVVRALLDSTSDNTPAP